MKLFNGYGITKTIGEWIKDARCTNGITMAALRCRLAYGWSLEDAITKEVACNKQALCAGDKIGHCIIDKIKIDSQTNLLVNSICVMSCDCGNTFERNYTFIREMKKLENKVYSCGCMKLLMQKQTKSKRNARYRKSNLDKLREYKRSWRIANKHLVANAQNRRRDLESNGTWCTESVALYLIARSCEPVACYICGKVTTISEDRHVDHITPLSKGGKHSIENLAIACVECNLSKRDKTIEEFMAIRAYAVN